MTKPPAIGDALAEKRRSPEEVLEYFGEDADLIVGLGNAEPDTVLDQIEARAEELGRPHHSHQRYVGSRLPRPVRI